jgi:hypothetical protein
MKERKEKG